jgi:hypothetical protein
MKENHDSQTRFVKRKRPHLSLWAYATNGWHDSGGGAYHPILRRLEEFSDEKLRSILGITEKRSSMVLDLEERDAAAVKKLKERGLVSPYLRL